MKFGDSLIELAVVAELLTAMHDGGGGLKAKALERGAVTKLFGSEVVSLLVEIVGGFVLLAGFRVLTLGVEIFRFVGEGGEG